MLYKLSSYGIRLSERCFGVEKNHYFFCIWFVSLTVSRCGGSSELIDKDTLAGDNTTTVCETGLSTVDQRNAADDKSGANPGTICPVN